MNFYKFLVVINLARSFQRLIKKIEILFVSISKCKLNIYQITNYKLPKMSCCEAVDCPICMEQIEGTRNVVTTECGHCFHARCLMTSVAHNGFGCPYCRTIMADQPEEEASTIYEGEDDEDVEDFEDDEDALRGLRFFMNNLNGVEHDEEDVEAEEELDESPPNPSQIPTVEIVSRLLREQGVTFEQLVCIRLGIEHSEYEHSQSISSLDDSIFDKIYDVISNYRREQVEVQEEVQEEDQEEVPVEVRVEVREEVREEVQEQEVPVEVQEQEVPVFNEFDFEEIYKMMQESFNYEDITPCDSIHREEEMYYWRRISV